ncbi:MAG: polysulfide reductase NrfD [Nitrospirae bacterium]|nr:polysulfide reductase NrfD [Nitrospirota bacterium]
MANGYKTLRASTVVTGVAKSLDASFFAEWASVVRDLLSGSKSFYLMILLGAAIVYFAAMGGLDAMRMGYRHAYAVTREIPWGILISTYIFFVVTSTGLCIVSSIGHVFGVKNFMPIASRAVFLSIVTIMAGFTVIFFEIENPFRMAIYNLISPNLTSNIWWMGTLYGAYMVFMIVEFVMLLLKQHRFAMYAGLLGLVSGIVAHSNLGAIFAMLHGREYWYGPYLPVYFIASAIMSGCATIILFTWVAYKASNREMEEPMKKSMEAIGKLCTMMIAVLMFFTSWKLITGSVAGGGKVEAIRAMMAGPYAMNFWVFEVGMGMVIPFGLFLMSKWKDMKMMAVATFMMMVAIFIMRYDLVLIGQIVPSWHELGVSDYPQLLSYTPSLHEFAVVLGGMGMVAISFMLGEKVFKGHKSEDH